MKRPAGGRGADMNRLFPLTIITITALTLLYMAAYIAVNGILGG